MLKIDSDSELAKVAGYINEVVDELKEEGYGDPNDLLKYLPLLDNTSKDEGLLLEFRHRFDPEGLGDEDAMVYWLEALDNDLVALRPEEDEEHIFADDYMDEREEVPA